MSFQDIGRNQPAAGRRTANGLPVRAGGFGAAGTEGRSSYNGAAAAPLSRQAAPEPARDPRTARLSEYLLQYSQNVTILHRIVQTLGGIKDTAEVRDQCECQVGVVADIGRRAEAELQSLGALLSSAAADELSRQEAARLRAAHAKLTKDYNRVSRLAKDLEVEAARRAEDLDRRRRETAAAEVAVAARIFGAEDSADSAGGGALRGPQQQQLQAQMAEEAINQAIIEETEAELGAINKSLHAVHEIFKDLASMVSQQQEQVEHIEEQTEAAHQRAQQGLKQVQQASHYQPSCSIS